MDPLISPPAKPSASPPRFRWDWLVPALGVLAFAWMVAAHMGAHAGGSDSSGYLNNARLLAQGRATLPMRLVPGLDPASVPAYTAVPLGFIPNEDHVTMTPTYPMGLPLLIAGAARLVGWTRAPGLVMALHALAGLWLVFRMARDLGLTDWWAWLGVLVLAVSPIYLMMSVQLMSDVPALVWVTAAVWLAWSSGPRPWRAAAAGFALALAVLVRPTNLLAIIPVALALGWSPRRWLLLGLGGLPGAAFLGYFNLTAYGRLLTTGYGSVGWEFGRQYLPATFLNYSVWLPMELTPLCLLALGLPVLWRRQAKLSAVLASWAVPLPSFYLFYSHTHDAWWCLRFLLPAFPALILAAILVGRALLDRLTASQRSTWLAVAAVAVAAHGIAWSHHFRVLHASSGERTYTESSLWIQSHLPANAVIASMQTSGAMFYYTPFTFFRWDMIRPADFERIAQACAAAGRPVYAMLFPYEMDDPKWAAFAKHLPGRWVQIGAVREVSIWRYAGSPTSP